MAARRQAFPADPLDVGDPGERLGREEAEAHRFAGDTTHGAQDLVGGRRGEAFGEPTRRAATWGYRSAPQ